MNHSSTATQDRIMPLWGWFLVLLALVAPPHLVGIDKFATIDEPWWVISGSNYYYALTHGDFENTIYDYHPAVTTTWVVTGGMLTVFPEYRGFGQGYFDVRKPNFDEFLSEHGQKTLDLLRNSRVIQSVLLIGLAAILFFLLQVLLPPVMALVGVVLAFDAPYFLGHSRLLNHEGMLTMFVLVSLAAFLAYLKAGRKLVYLLISGAAFGLAQLTKSSSIIVVGLTGMMLFLGLFERGTVKSLGLKVLDAAKAMAIWLASAALLYVILWPGMWVAPGRMLYEVYGNAFSYAFQGARLDVAGDLEPAAFSLDTDLSGVALYLDRLLLRSTPLAWVGWLLLIPALVRQKAGRSIRGVSGTIFLAAFLFILMFGLAKGRDSSHYILVSFFSLDLLAGLGWVSAYSWLVEGWPARFKGWVQGILMAALLLAQLASGWSSYPYYYTYSNPILASFRTVSGTGYGEGLDQAAEYLSQKKDAEGLRVFAYGGMGPFSYFFPGRVEVMKKAYFWDDGLPDIIRGMRWSEYMVVYAAVQDRLPECKNFLAALESIEPDHVISLDGVETVRIYRSRDIPESVYEVLAGSKQTQP